MQQTTLFPEPPRPTQLGRTTISHRPARGILTRATGFLAAYDFTMNPYAGCSFGCSYCYAADFSKDRRQQENWGYWVQVKENAAELLARRPAGELDGKRIYMSSVTDPYQPVERRLRLTRQLLEVLAERHRPKLVVQTRSPDVVRDSDLFGQIEANGGRVQVNMTVTTDDEEVRRSFEPSCPANPARLKAIAQTSAAGVNSCITMTPLLLVGNPHAFAAQLLATGVRKFIIQPFHFNRQTRPGQFIANTREPALELMARRLDCSRSNLRNRYLEHHREVAGILRDRLRAEGIEPGQGKNGFQPPF